MGFAAPPPAAAEPLRRTGRLTGTVLDAGSDRPLAGANATVDGLRAGAASDAHGRFSIGGLPAGPATLTVRYLGYDELRIDPVDVPAGGTLDLGALRLVQRPVELADVVMSPGSFSLMGPGPASRQTLGGEDLKNMSFAEDITRAVTRLPGVASNDFSSKFSVRGGEADETLITLDGMELYEPFHQRDFSGGLFSTVDIEAVESVELLTGGFAAEHGDRQSAVFALRSKQDRDGAAHRSLALSPLIARATAEGPLPGERGSYLVTARRGMLDQAFKLAGFDEQIPFYYDLFGKVDLQLPKGRILSLHALRAGDQTGIRDISDEAQDIHDTKYVSTTGWLTLRSIPNERLFSRSILYAGQADHGRHGYSNKPWEPSDKMIFRLTDERSFTRVGFKQDWDWRAAERFQLKAGFDVKRLESDYDYRTTLSDWRIHADETLFHYQDSLALKMKPSGTQLGAYASLRSRLTKVLHLESGLRVDRAPVGGERVWSPRLGLAWTIGPETALRVAWGRYWQFQSLNDFDAAHGQTAPNPAELAEHVVLGLEHRFGNGVGLRLEGYAKRMPDLATAYQNLRDPWEVFPEARNDVVRLGTDGARSRGVELFLKYDEGRRVSWWLSYSLARAEERVVSLDFDGMVGERTGWLPRAANQTHTVYADLNWRPNARWHLNLSWQYDQGVPYTDYVYRDTRLPAPADSLHFYPVHGTFRGRTTPPYHRMDLRINRHWQLKASRLTAWLHVINLYNRENLRKFDLDVRNDAEEYEVDENGDFRYFRDDKYWLTIMPVIGASWEF